MRFIRLALAQMNTTVGDLVGNADRVIALTQEAKAKGVDLIAFPELVVTGYPPEDLLLKPQFLSEAHKQTERISLEFHGITGIVGTPLLAETGFFHPAVHELPDGHAGMLFNAAAIVADGAVVSYYRKIFLPNYGVFDEQRYFSKGDECPVFEIGGVRVGVNVCEDIWYRTGPMVLQCLAGSEIIVNINASPYHRGKGNSRQNLISDRALEHRVFVAYVNAVGGQDELVFDGQSLLFGPDGQLISRGPQFEEALLIADIELEDAPPAGSGLAGYDSMVPVGAARHYFVSGSTKSASIPLGQPLMIEPLQPLAEVYQALVTGTRDYVRKSGFLAAVVGLSGGIDSALTMVIAADALGAENVTAFFMPSEYTASQSYDDSARLAENLGVRLEVLPIKALLDGYLTELTTLFSESMRDVTEENLQARIRGNLLMAASNKFGWIVLTTGNKSEMATGYATLYGDMAGGFAVIKDVPKTLVQELTRYRNSVEGTEVIPESIIIRPPTAELRPNQKDEDSLPPYSELDPIIEAYVESDWSVDEMLASGMSPSAVELTIRLVDRSEYKRRQAPPGVKITRRNFGRDRRLPIVNRFHPRIES